MDTISGSAGSHMPTCIPGAIEAAPHTGYVIEFVDFRPDTMLSRQMSGATASHDWPTIAEMFW